MMEELKRCPFCGGKAIIKKARGYTGYYVACGNALCFVLSVTRMEDSKDAAIAAWNRREGGQDG